jgi:hypothetical protein
MSIRLLAWGALCAASCLFGVGCARTAEAQTPLETTQPAEEEKTGQFCGGIAAIQCPEGQACVDDPKDDCDPTRSGADCGGICVKDKPKKKDCDDPTRKYVSQDPEQCAAIRFFCEEGFQPFFDDCGCGCEPVPTPTP